MGAALTSCPRLRNLDLHGGRTDDTERAALLSALLDLLSSSSPAARTIEVISGIFCWLKVDGSMLLRAAEVVVAHCPRLTSLELGNKDVTDEAWEAAAQVLGPQRCEVLGTRVKSGGGLPGPLAGLSFDNLDDSSCKQS